MSDYKGESIYVSLGALSLFT